MPSRKNLYVLLLTDGEIAGVDKVIEVAKNSGHRVFIVGIGASPAEPHLRRLASATGGMCDFVTPGEDVEPAVLRMFHRLRATPLTALRLEWPPSLQLRWAQALPAQAFEADAWNVLAFADAQPADGAPWVVKLWGRPDGSQDEALLAQAEVLRVESTVNTLARMAAAVQYATLPAANTKATAASVMTQAQQLVVLYQLVTPETNFILVHERSAEEKAMEMPQAHAVPHMLAAGWSGTGSVNRLAKNVQFKSNRTGFHDLPLDAMNGLAGARIGPRFDGILAFNRPGSPLGALPAVWRTQDKASIKSRLSGSDGMDDFEIPAFLRKASADESSASPAITRHSINKHNSAFWAGVLPARKTQAAPLPPECYTGITPAGMEEWLRINHPSLWPTTYGELSDLGLGIALCEWLEFGIGAGRPEKAVVAAFVAVFSSQSAKPVDAEIAALIRTALAGIQPGKWPAAVVNFPQEVAV